MTETTPPADENQQPMSHDEAFFQRFGRTRKVQGGIKSQQKRGKKAEHTWWGQRWIFVLESFEMGARLDRGRSYARRGQVLNIAIEKGQVDAEVQGSRREPYHVTIRVKTLTDLQWKRLAREFAGKVIYAAKLLSRQMPMQIETAFHEHKLTLFPSRVGDLQTSCTCPDMANPCKHIAAVYLLLAEEFDRDPFLIFRLRGLTEDELMKLLDAELGGNLEKPGFAAVPLADRQTPDSEPISCDPERFWKSRPLDIDMGVQLDAASRNSYAGLPRSLGAFPFWRGEQSLWTSLEEIYRRAASETVQRLSEAD